LIRFVLFVGTLLAALVWLEPRIVPQDRTLVLRMRTTEEVLKVARERARVLGARLTQEPRPSETPAVGGGDARPPAEHFSEEERDRLDYLVQQAIEEP
jgi:hypothetical protein